ncbi:MAG: hypothetical protein ACKOXB_10490 [Flavobacteriales bacterium]
MKPLLLSALILLSLTLVSEAQVRVFDATKESASLEGSKNVFKLGLFHLVNGRYSAFYERRFSDLFSLEGGLGFTYGNYYNIFSDNDLSGATIKFGPTTELTAKFFPGRDAQFGTYFGVNVRYTDYKYTDIASTLDFKENQIQAMISIGHQTYDWADVFVLDYYISLGLLNKTVENIASDSNNNPVVVSENFSSPCVRLGLKLGFDW